MTATSTTQTAATTNAPVPQKNQTKSERIAALHAANMARKAEAAKNVVNGTTAPKAALRDEADKAAADFDKRPPKNRGHKEIPVSIGTKPAAKPATAPAKASSPKASKAAKRASKTEGAMADAVAKLASRKEGATRAELEALTGWKRAGWPWLFYNKQTGRGIAPSRGLKLVITKRPGADGKPGRTAYCLVKA